jgi:macrophage erythroblast attacher
LINWFREQTNLLIVDYLIKSNTRTDSNIGLLLLSSLAQKNPKFTKLIDYDLFETFNKIFISIIEDHDLTLVINWFNENKNFLKKANSNLEFEINYCKFLSLIDNADVAGATQFSKAYLSSFGNLSNYQDPNLTNYHRNQDKMKDIGGLLLFLAAKLNPESRSYSTTLLMNSPRFHEYELLLSDDRWISLSQCFMDNFTKLYGISKNYPLFIYLSAGLTSLKTKSCFHNTENSIFKTKTTDETDPPPLSNENSPFLTDIIHRGPNHYYKILKKINNCPVCSPELYNISRNLPYAQLITSIFNNPYKLPNGNIYPYDKLLAPTDKYFSEKNTLLRLGKVKDPLTKQLCLVEDCVRVYPA